MKTGITTAFVTILGFILVSILAFTFSASDSAAESGYSLPVADFSSATGSVDEPSTITFTDTSTSAEGITAWAWTFGDGQTSTAQNPVHVFIESGEYTVTLTVTEADSDTDSHSMLVTVTNVAAQIAAIPDPSIGEGRNLSLSASFTDPGILDTHTATIDWGDGSSETITVTESGGAGTVDGEHYYAANGIYPATLTVSDDDGGTSQRSFMVTANDPAAGKPDLRLSCTGVQWESYADYLARVLTVDFEIYNPGVIIAYNPMLTGSSSTGGVRLRAEGLPRRLDVYSPGGLITGIVREDRIMVGAKYDVPDGVGWFLTTLYISAEDGQGNEYGIPDWL